MVWTRGKCSFWRRLSPGKNPPLMLEHLDFHPSIQAPSSPLPLPPSLLPLSLYMPPPSVLFWSGDFFFFFLIPASSAFGGQHTASLSRRRGKHSELEPLPPPAPVHAGRAHAPDPAHPRNRPTGSACLSVQRLTNKPPSTVCSVSHPNSPSIPINTFTVRPSPHAVHLHSCRVEIHETLRDGMG